MHACRRVSHESTCMNACMHACMYAHMHVPMHANHIFMPTFQHACTHARTPPCRVFMYVFMYTCMYACMLSVLDKGRGMLALAERTEGRWRHPSVPPASLALPLPLTDTWQTDVAWPLGRVLLWLGCPPPSCPFPPWRPAPRRLPRGAQLQRTPFGPLG